MATIPHVDITDFSTLSGAPYPRLRLQYQIFGQPLGSAPVVVVNHALTGNSQVMGSNGWWNEAVGYDRPINAHRYTILCFDIPGNGYGNSEFIERPEQWSAADVARVFLLGLEALGIPSVFAVVGSSIGGGIAWEMVALAPGLFEHLVAIAADWKASDWVIANCLVQERLLATSAQPLHDARLHAMLCYRSPASFKARFNRSVNPERQRFNVETWLLHHGEKLEKRFALAAYRLMNHLVRTIDITRGRGSFCETMRPVTTQIHIIGTSSDTYFVPEENRQCYQELKSMGKYATYHELNSIHGHDAFLIEYGQLNTILRKFI